MATLTDIMNKRPAQKIEKLYPGVTTKEIADLTVRDLNNIGLHIMLECGMPVTGNVFVPQEALRIIGAWAHDKKVSII